MGLFLYADIINCTFWRRKLQQNIQDFVGNVDNIIKRFKCVSSDMPIRPSDYCDDLSTAIAQYLLTAGEVLKRVDHLLGAEFQIQASDLFHD